MKLVFESAKLCYPGGKMLQPPDSAALFFALTHMAITSI